MLDKLITVWYYNYRRREREVVLKMVRTEKENKKLKWLKNDDYATICRKYEKKLAEYKNKKG